MGLDLTLYRALRSVEIPEDKALAVVEALEAHIRAQQAAKPGLAQRQLYTQPHVATPQLSTHSDIDPLVSRFTIDVSLMLIAFVLILIAAM
ncbi:hypothetical protein [Pseudomonas oryzihabitans]|uniref:hypothetical protein n=1 Tax=Pseudomonas oryzihabitans TaxID=47885 RepID=UPI00289521A4|nr:hypothetical protein [Pseudomonas oryzihabitans]MDT3723150.1 hypothetical protein [Pseudomonas oryzihabitans]